MLEIAYLKSIAWLQNFDSKPFALPKFWLFCIVWLCVFSPPKGITDWLDRAFGTPVGYNHAPIFRAKTQHLLTPITTLMPEVADRSNGGKINFRLLMPTIARCLSMDLRQSMLFQNALGLLFVWIMILLTNKHFKAFDPLLVYILAFGCLNIFFAKACFIDIYGWFDGMAFLLLLLAMFFENSLLIALCCFLACFTDERAFISTVFVGVWHGFIKNNLTQHFSIKTFFLSAKPIFWVLASLFAAVCVRWFLRYKFGLTTPISNPNDLGFLWILRQANLIPLGLYSAFESFWLLLVLAIGAMWLRRQWFLLCLFGLPTLAIGVGSFAVADITRSLGYGFPFVFISVYYLCSIEKNSDLIRKLLVVLCLLNALTATTYVLGENIYWHYPLLLKIGTWIY